MAKTRGGGSFAGRKRRRFQDDVPEQGSSSSPVRRMVLFGDDYLDEDSVFWRGPRGLKAMVGRGATGSEHQDVTNPASVRASRKRVPFELKGTECEPKKCRKQKQCKKQKKSKQKSKVNDGEEEGRVVRREEEEAHRDGQREGDEANRDASEEYEEDGDFFEEAGFEEQEKGSRELTLLFGDEAREDNYEREDDSGDDVCDEDKIPDPYSSDEENEENGWLGEPYREDVDPDELLRLGNTFSDADDFKHACLRYTLKSRYNIKYHRSGTYKIGAMCAATPKKDCPPCPWKIYCSFERSKMKLQIKTYVNCHTCERTGKFV